MASSLISPTTQPQPQPQPQPQCSSAVNAASFVSTKLRRDKNSSNYISWKEQMLCLIESQGFVGFIDGGAPPPPNDSQIYAEWRRSDRLVKGWILGALSDEVVERVVRFDSARELWLELEKNFSIPERAQPPPPPPPPHEEKDQNEYLALYVAAVSGEWDAAKAILEQDPNAVKARLALTLQTVLHVAVSSGKSTSFVEKLVDFISDNSSLAITDGLGFNPLHLAALTGNLPAAKLLVHRLPDLLYVRSCYDKFPVQLAAEVAHRQTLEFLISKTRDDLHSNPFAGETGLMLLSRMIDADFFDMALDLVEKYPDLARMNYPTSSSALQRIARKETAFSMDARLNLWERLIYFSVELEMESQTQQSTDIENQTCCALLLSKLQGWRRVVRKWHSTLCKLVIQHLVPGVKGIYEKKLMREQALRFLKCLCKHMKSMKHEEAASIYTDAVLSASRLGIKEVVEIIVETFPSAIFSIDGDTDRNFLHLAVQNRCEKVFNLMYQTANHKYMYLNEVDSYENSILHLAASLAPPHKLNLVAGAALQMQREIQWYKEVDKFISPNRRGWVNKAGKTAAMIFTEEHRDLKVEGEKWMKDTANSCTIAAALIATVVFAAAITVPGGNQSDSGYPIFSKESAFTIFAVSDAASLFTSTTSLLMFLSILTSRYAEEDFLYALPKRLCIGLVSLFLSILFMMAAFSSTLYLVFGQKKAWVLLPVAAFACLPISCFVLLQFPLLIAVISSTYGSGIFGKKSDRPFH
ncbi:hypothetical protein C2S53_020722 [Perilla frutescens var. hirtella]|uniref:PGG domain-containing protein n=1 Tax=Perilla frutescens var. hirtella TaxID=608512 RepID=A0AAD4JFN9_PERFH|nr:hypothetical protein C2S53_020722 [Perilla frutescens var. hirtella]